MGQTNPGPEPDEATRRKESAANFPRCLASDSKGMLDKAKGLVGGMLGRNESE